MHMFTLFIYTVIIVIRWLFYVTIAEHKLLAFFFWRPVWRSEMFYSRVAGLKACVRGINFRYLNWFVILNNVVPPADDKIFRDRPRDIFVLNQTALYDKVYWTEYHKIITEFYDKTFVVLLTILVISFFSIEILHRDGIEYNAVHGGFNVFMYLRRITNRPDMRMMWAVTIVCFIGSLYICLVYWHSIERYARIAAICDEAGVRAISDTYVRVAGINDYFDAIRCFQWESIYNRPDNDYDVPSYRRSQPVRWLGNYYPHFNLAFRKHAEANFSYIEWRDVYQHALQLEASVIRLTEAERGRAIMYIKNYAEDCLARGLLDDEPVRLSLRVLKSGQLDLIDKLAGQLLRNYYEPVLRNKFFEEAAKCGHTPDHFVYYAPVAETVQYKNVEGGEPESEPVYVAQAGLMEGKELWHSWSDHSFTFPRFLNRRELQENYGPLWKGYEEQMGLCECALHTNPRSLHSPLLSLTYEAKFGQVCYQDYEGNIFNSNRQLLEERGDPNTYFIPQLKNEANDLLNATGEQAPRPVTRPVIRPIIKFRGLRPGRG